MPANKALCQLAGTYKETGEGGLLRGAGGAVVATRRTQTRSHRESDRGVSWRESVKIALHCFRCPSGPCHFSFFLNIL